MDVVRGSIVDKLEVVGQVYNKAKFSGGTKASTSNRRDVRNSETERERS